MGAVMVFTLVYGVQDLLQGVLESRKEEREREKQRQEEEQRRLDEVSAPTVLSVTSGVRLCVGTRPQSSLSSYN